MLRLARLVGYRPRLFWEMRARELAAGYDHPETWAERGWVGEGDEAATVVGWLRELNCTSVLVIGAGSGRQYRYLLEAGFAVSGCDISRRLVQECRRRYPTVATVRADIAASVELDAADAVLSVSMLQHVVPDRIAAAVANVSRLARRAVVLRELAELPVQGPHQFTHDYDRLLAGWRRWARVVSDERPRIRVELSCWTPA